jgi:hypothetical protein
MYSYVKEAIVDEFPWVATVENDVGSLADWNLHAFIRVHQLDAKLLNVRSTESSMAGGDDTVEEELGNGGEAKGLVAGISQVVNAVSIKFQAHAQLQ